VCVQNPSGIESGTRIKQHVRGKQDVGVAEQKYHVKTSITFVDWYLIDSPFPIFTRDRTAAAAENEFLPSNSFLYSLIEPNLIEARCILFRHLWSLFGVRCMKIKSKTSITFLYPSHLFRFLRWLQQAQYLRIRFPIVTFLLNPLIEVEISISLKYT